MATLAIIGAGAMGCLLAHKLSSVAEIWLLDGWQAQVTAINQHGLHYESASEQATSHPHATTNPSDIPACQAVLVLVKAHQTTWAAEQIKQLQGDPLVITLQNGLGNREHLAANLGSERVGQAVTSLGATLLGPGRVRHAGMGSTLFGRAPRPEVIGQIAGWFHAAGLPSEQHPDLDSIVWGKLIVNVGINALSALLRVPNGTLSTLPVARALVADIVAEAVAVAATRGITLPYHDPLGHVLAIAEATAANRSSMLQDVMRGSPSEIATINAAIVHEGQRLGIATPINQLLTRLIEAIDQSSQVRQ
ncbi:MAG: 2-dehydropantoate 2-reductase [Roseiflexaceae bacterium]